MRTRFLLFAAILLVGIAFVGGDVVRAQQEITEIGGYKLIVPLPNVPGEGSPNTLAAYVRFIYLWAMGVVALSAGVMVLIGGFRYLTAAGNPGREEDAKDQIQHALLGMLVVVGSYVILRVLNPSLVTLGGAEIPVPERIVVQTDTTTNLGAQDGRCFPSDASSSGLGGTSCSAIGPGWHNPDTPNRCSGCGASDVCCVCVLGEEDCEPTEHSCVIPGAEGTFPEGHPVPEVCGPFLRKDCNGKCPQDTCIAGNSCSDQFTKTQAFQITIPVPPSGGNTIVPVNLTPIIQISIEGPETVETVEVHVFTPSGAEALGSPMTCAFLDAGVCALSWEACDQDLDCPEPPPSGTFRMEAKGLDETGKPIARMTDTRNICFDCGPSATFEVTNASGGAVACSAPGVFGIGASGSALLDLDASATRSLGASQIASYSWSEGNGTITANPGSAKTKASFPPGDHTVTLLVLDNSGAKGEATRSFSVVEACP